MLEMNETPWTGRWLGRLARFATEQHGVVLCFGLFLAGLSIWLAVGTLETQTGREQLIDPDRPAYERYRRFQEAYDHDSFLVILFDADEEGARRKIEQLVESAAEQGMTFYAEQGQWEVGKVTIEDTVDELADKVAKQKKEMAR